MKVVLVTPNFHQSRGNTITVQRIADGLNKEGIETEVISIEDDSIKNPIELPSSDVVHGFHAYRFYKFKERLNNTLDTFVITITGTDVNHDLFDPSRRNDVIECLNEAMAIHVFHEEARQTLINEVENVSDKIHVIPQAISEFRNSISIFQKEANTFLFLLPAGIRKVKNVPFAIHMLKHVHAMYPEIRLLIVGPVIEEAEGKIVKDLVEQHKDWVKYLGQVPHTTMGSIYKQADVMINTSLSEGQSTAIIEAMGYGLPVLVSDNEGNRSLVTNQKTGLVYKNENEFLDYSKELVNNNELGEKIGEFAKRYIKTYHSSTSEIQTLIEIYNNVKASSKAKIEI